MDRIAREGTRFPNAFTHTPLCSPARASILTSRYGSELGITDWINPKRDAGVGLDPAIVTWPRLLRQAGYGTALFGKWHLGNEDKYHPTKYGYQVFVGFRGGGSPSKDPVLEKNGVNSRRTGFIVDIITDEAIDWLQRRERTAPFAISIHYREPHTPYLPLPDEDWEKFSRLDPAIPNPTLSGLDVEWVKKATREYLAAVASIDRNIGRLLDVLETLEMPNTMVIFTVGPRLQRRAPRRPRKGQCPVGSTEGLAPSGHAQRAGDATSEHVRYVGDDSAGDSMAGGDPARRRFAGYGLAPGLAPDVC